MKGVVVILFSFFALSCKNAPSNYYIYKNYPKFSDNTYWGASAPYKMYSSNKQFQLQSFPYEYVYTTDCDHCQGISNVFERESRKMRYKINRYFKVDNVFISNSGKSIAYINNVICNNELSDSCDNTPLQFYKNGILFKKYTFKDLIDTDYAHSWLYHDTTYPVLANNSHYLVGDTLYIITSKNQILRFDINSGELIDNTPINYFLKNVQQISYPKEIVTFFKEYEFEGLPKIADSNSFRTALSKYLNATIISFDEAQEYGVKYYEIDLSATINNDGKCLSSKVRSNEHILVSEANELTAKIKTFLTKTQFVYKNIPYNLSEWTFHEFFFVRKNPAIVAKQEYIRYNYGVCHCDTLNGRYIPKDLPDCIHQLDILLNEKTKNDIKNNNMDFGYGMSIRNNWGLKAGTRLTCYFNQKQIYNSEYMSAAILTAYNLHINKKQFNADSLMRQYAIIEKKWRETIKQLM